MFWITLPLLGIDEEYVLMSPLPVDFPSSTVMPNAVSKLLTEANPCAVGQTPHILWAI
jgi:hypothetical protein